MASYSFDIHTSRVFFLVFMQQVERFTKDPLSTSQAVICAMFAWHLTEWIFHEYYEDAQNSQWKKLSDYYKYVKSQCPALGYMQDICNGTKHSQITYYHPLLSDTQMHQGAFDRGFSRGFDISYLHLTLEDGTVLRFEDELQKVKVFWENTFLISGDC